MAASKIPTTGTLKTRRYVILELDPDADEKGASKRVIGTFSSVAKAFDYIAVPANGLTPGSVRVVPIREVH